MVRNSNTLYRVIKLPASTNPVVPPGSVDCEPQLLPVFCVVPVAGTYDRPISASFSLDGNTVYVLNCGPECGGTTAGITVLQTGALLIDNIPTVDPLSPSAPSPLASLGVPNPVPIPGGATAALSNGTTLYVAGQSLYSLGAGGALGSTPRADGLFTGYLTAVNLSNYSVSPPISHLRRHAHQAALRGRQHTLGRLAAVRQRRARGHRAELQLPHHGHAGQARPGRHRAGHPQRHAGWLDNCSLPQHQPEPVLLRRSDGHLLGAELSTRSSPRTVARFTPSTPAARSPTLDDPAVGTTPAAGSEINNTNITIQGTVLDVAYMDALDQQRQLTPPMATGDLSQTTVDILAIAAHRDDVEQTCGGTLLVQQSLGWRTGILDLTQGESGTRGTAEDRAREAAEAARILRVSPSRGARPSRRQRREHRENRLKIAAVLRRLRPRVVILPYWQGRHPDHYTTAHARLRSLLRCRPLEARPPAEHGAPHRPYKILYASLYADVRPTFVVDITPHIETRLASLLAYRSQYGNQTTGSGLFVPEDDIRERTFATARHYGLLAGVRYAEPFVQREVSLVSDLMMLPVQSI